VKHPFQGKEQRETRITRILRMLLEVFPGQIDDAGSHSDAKSWKNFQGILRIRVIRVPPVPSPYAMLGILPVTLLEFLA
jgi:hypothetical protein